MNISFFFLFQRAHDVVTRSPVRSVERSARRSSLKTRYPVGRRGKRSPNTVIYKWPHVCTTTRRPPRLRTQQKVITFFKWWNVFKMIYYYQLLHPKSDVILILWSQCHQIGKLDIVSLKSIWHCACSMKLTKSGFKRLACCHCNSGVLSLNEGTLFVAKSLCCALIDEE